MLPTPTFFIALRFLAAHKRSMALTTLGVTLGVALYIAALAQTEGFEQFYIATILGTEGSLVIADRFQPIRTRIIADKPGQQVLVSNQQERKYYPGIADAERLTHVLSSYPDVIACSPIVEGSAFFRSGFETEAISLEGIDLDQHLRATDFGKEVVKGSIGDFRSDSSGLCVGETLAERMRLYIGQNVYIIGPDNETRRFHVDEIYSTGVWAFDVRNVFVHARTAQAFLHKPYFTSFMIVKLKDPSRAPALASEFENLLSHSAASWQERQQGNLQIFHVLRLSASLIVSMIILLSGFGIFNVLSISVMQRSKEIAILRSMGYRKQDIAAIFLWQGACVAVLGILSGWALGALLTYTISRIPISLRGILRADYFLVEWSLEQYLVAAVLALVAVFCAAYVPALRASRLEPAAILRGTSQ